MELIMTNINKNINTNFPSLHYLLRNSAFNIKSPESTFMMSKAKGEYIKHSYQESINQINALSAFLIKWGVGHQEMVGIIIENCPEYICFDQALMQIGAVNVSIYPTLGESEVEYILNDSGTKVILVGTPFLLRRIKKIKPNTKLELIITAFDSSKENDECILNYSDIIKEGSLLYENQKEEVERRLEAVSREDLSCLLYTSGTTGRPKGAMLTHNNFITNVQMASDLFPKIDYTYRFLSFLPLCHVYERTATYYLSTLLGSEIAFAQSLETLSNNMIEVKPNAILTVPRLLERIEERVRKAITAKGGFSLKLFNWAVKVGESARHCREEEKSYGIFLKIKLYFADWLVFSKVMARLGGNVKVMISGGGAMPKHVGEFFGNIGMLVCEGYGLTETSPLVSVNEPHRQLFGTVGRIGLGVEVAIQNPDTKEIYAVQTKESCSYMFESLEGEILVRGPNVMKGYWNLPEATAEAIDKEGWLHTGDVGKFYKGYLKITDRIKNILVNSFGKNIYPTPIENAYLKSHRIEQVFLIGDKQEYITAIIVPSKEDMKETFGFKEDYFSAEEEFIIDEKIKNWIEEDLEKFGKELGKFERIKNFVLKRRPFTLEAGEVTPTQKTKRKVIETKYANTISDMYVKIVN